jgi:hypothetical protein
MEHYFRNKHKTFLGLIMPVLSMIFLSMVLFVGLLYLFYDVIKFEMFTSIVITGLIVIILLVLFIYHIINGPDYIVTDKEVIFKKKNKIVHEFPYKDYKMSSYIIKQSYNGIPAGNSRHLVVDNGKKEKKYLCALTKKKFDEFMSLISAYSGKLDINGGYQEIPNILSQVNKDFFLDKNKIFRTIAVRKYSGFIFTAFVLAVVFFFISYFEGSKIWLILIGATVCILLYFIAVFLGIKNISKKTPESIKLRTSEIYLDEEVFNYNEIRTISLTPPTYYTGNLNRVLRIEKNDGKKRNYILGFKVYRAGKKDKVFSEYEEFAYMLEGILGNSPGKFQYDL